MLRSACVVVLTAVYTSVSVEVRDYCPWERFNATCRQPSEVILMTSALYGRMRYGRCVKERHGSEGCATDVLRYLDGLCSGRYRCQLEIPDAHLHKAQPCPRELMSYLEASYYCVPVQGNGGETNECRRVRIQTGEGTTEIHYGYRIHGESGFLASITTRESTIGTADCPWVLRTQSGHRFILSLISFQRISSRKAPSPSCAQTIVVEEWNQTTEAPSCSSSSSHNEQREKRFHLSTSNEIQVYIKRSEGQETTHYNDGEFILKYQAINRHRDDRESEGRERGAPTTGEIRCNDTIGHSCHIFSCTSASCLEKVKNTTILSSVEVHKDEPGLRANVPCCTMPNTKALLLVGFMVAISVALGVISLFIFLHCVSGFSRATNRRDSKGYRSSRVGIDFIEADCLRDEDSSGHATRTKIGPESAMSECRGEGGGGRGGGGSHSCIYQKLNNIRIVESSRLPSHLSNQCGTFHKQGPDVELEEAVDDETAFRGPRCVINVPDDGLFRDITKI